MAAVPDDKPCFELWLIVGLRKWSCACMGSSCQEIPTILCSMQDTDICDIDVVRL